MTPTLTCIFVFVIILLGSSLNSESLWHTLTMEMSTFSTKGWVVVAGDFNARTGVESDYVFNDSARYLPLPDDYSVDVQLLCYSQDDSVSRLLFDLCCGSGLKILNGRTGEDNGIGSFTPRGCSVVDY